MGHYTTFVGGGGDSAPGSKGGDYWKDPNRERKQLTEAT